MLKTESKDMFNNKWYEFGSLWEKLFRALLLLHNYYLTLYKTCFIWKGKSFSKTKCFEFKVNIKLNLFHISLHAINKFNENIIFTIS
jgi:hypothetical protein